MRESARLAIVSVIAACGGQRPAPPPTRPSPATWMVRVCNDTGRNIVDLMFNVDRSARNLRAGTCTRYWDWELQVAHSTEPIVVSAPGFYAAVDGLGGTPLPHGFYAYHVTIRDLAAQTIDVRVVEEYPPTLARVCNEATEVVDGLAWNDDVSSENALPPAACSPWRPPSDPSGYLGTSFTLGGDAAMGTGTKYTIAPPAPGTPALTPGKWTFHLEPDDRTAHVAVLRRDPRPE